jgi:hypothetical protein
MIKIYKLIYDNEIVYVGKTTQRLERRKAAGYGDTVPFFKECLIELIEETTDVSREEYWIEKLRSEGHALLNKRGGETGLDRKEWFENNKQYFKEYRENNKEKIKEYIKEYRLKNKEKVYE